MNLSEATWYTPEMRNKLELARAKNRLILALQEEVDVLVGGYAQEVMRQISTADAEQKADLVVMINNTPDSFFRTELMTALYERFGHPTLSDRPISQGQS